MAIQIAIIGLGQIGASIGLALGTEKGLVTRIGHDREVGNARLAEKMGALDKVSLNLPGAVEKADIVILALPTDQVRETMEMVAPLLKVDAVLMDTAPVKEKIAAWARELMPAGRHYVGLTPVLNPAYLQTHDSGVNAAHADLFKEGLMVIVAPPGTASEAVKLASDLTRLLGSSPMFAEPVEVDSLMASTHLLPQLMGAALLNITIDQPGWREGRKLAGRAYAEVTGTLNLSGETGGLSSSAILAQESMVRVLDAAIAALQAFRTEVKNEDVRSLNERLNRAQAGRQRWWDERQLANWTAEEMFSNTPLPKRTDFVSKLLFERRKDKDKDQ